MSHDRRQGLGLVIPSLLVVIALSIIAFACMVPAAIAVHAIRGFLRICDLVFAAW